MTKDARARLAGWLWFAVAVPVTYVAAVVPEDWTWFVLGLAAAAGSCAWQNWGFMQGYQQGLSDSTDANEEVG